MSHDIGSTRRTSVPILKLDTTSSTATSAVVASTIVITISTITTVMIPDTSLVMWDDVPLLSHSMKYHPLSVSMEVGASGVEVFQTRIALLVLLPAHGSYLTKSG